MPTEAEEREWRDPQNWRGGVLGVYVAPRDPRLWVPQRSPGVGLTLNFAHRSSWILLVTLIAPGLVVAGVAIWATRGAR